MILRLWHGLRLHKWLVFKVRVQRTGARVGGRSFAEFQRCSSHVQESQSARRRERARRSRVVLNSPFLDIPKGGWSNQSVGTGRSPACPAGFCKAFFHVRKDNLFVPLLFKLLSCLHIYTITTFVILLIHTILQPFIKV